VRQVLRSQPPPQPFACNRGESPGVYVASICSSPSQKWTGEFYEPSTLADIGLQIQLGHAPGYSCSNPKPAPRNLTIIHTNGLHHVTLDYCECDQYARAGSHRQQLLRRRFFPATHKEPKSCATFAVLEQFHMQNLQGKIAGYDFYSALEKLTDNAGLMKFKVRFFFCRFPPIVDLFITGLLQVIHAHGSRVAVPQDGQAGGPCPFSHWGKGNWTGRASNHLSSLSPPKYQSSERLGECPAGRKVSR
jgi:CxC2 like cysteine cluster associated with KDZ transposases